LFARRGDALDELATELSASRVATYATYAGDVRDADSLADAGADFASARRTSSSPMQACPAAR
jgi:hypothetical protein